MRWKRPLFLFHRWAGIALCAMFSLWFVSGIFMMYVEFPRLTAVERLSALPQLDFSSAKLPPGVAAAKLSGTATADAREPPLGSRAPIEFARITLGMLLGRPVYRFQVQGGGLAVVFADTGELLRQVTPAM